MPHRSQYLFVCLNRRPDGNPKGSCAARGSEAIYSRLRQLLAERKLNRVQARAASCSCLDMCATGPSICVEPQHIMYGRVTLEDVEEIVDAVEAGTIVERLQVQPDPSQGTS